VVDRLRETAEAMAMSGLSGQNRRMRLRILAVAKEVGSPCRRGRPWPESNNLVLGMPQHDDVTLPSGLPLDLLAKALSHDADGSGDPASNLPAVLVRRSHAPTDPVPCAEPGQLAGASPTGQERVRASRHGQDIGKVGSGFATEGRADRLVGLAEPGCGASIRLGEPRKALGEDASRTLRLRA
jgi:hypothetical protein